MPNVSGRAICARADFVRERFGEAGWHKVEARLPAPLLAALTQPLEPAGWYPMDLYAALSRAVVDTFGGSDGAALLEEVGAFAADRNAVALYGPMGKDPFEFFKHVAKLHSQTFDFGETSVVRRPGGCLME